MDLESMSAKDVALWLAGKGFCEEVTKAFEEQDMDGEAIATVLASAPGPDSLKDVLPKLGQRLKVYKAIKCLIVVEASEATGSDEESLVIETASAKSPSTASTIRISETSIDLTKKQSPVSNKRSSTSDNVGSAGCSQTTGIPNPFPIPRFRKLTQDKLDKYLFSDDDRKHMVSVLGIMILTYVEKASKKDCLCVAESLLRKYPFLKEPVRVF